MGKWTQPSGGRPLHLCGPFNFHLQGKIHQRGVLLQKEAAEKEGEK